MYPSWYFIIHQCLPYKKIGGSGTIRACPVVKRHRLDGVRRLVAHPHLPLYVSGGQDGAVLLWEWSHNQQVQIENIASSKSYSVNLIPHFNLMINTDPCMTMSLEDLKKSFVQ